MTRLKDGEPKHWHDALGNHRMPDPRKVYGSALRNSWSKDERAYAEHLEEHERLRVRPEPREGDSVAIRSLFAQLDNAEAQVRTISELILALREREQKD